MDRIDADLWMNILSFVNVVDACQGLQFTCKRFYYLVHHYQELAAPQLAAAFSEEECLLQLSRKPTLVLSFTTHALSDNQPTKIPRDAVVLGAIASDVQANIHGRVTTEPGVLMASFPPETTHVTSFYIGFTGSSLWETFMPEPGEDYQVIIVYICHSGNEQAEGIEGFIENLQSQYPNATIVGGVCEGGFVSTEDGIITQVENGIIGIMARNMPIKSIVSRGVKSLLDMTYHVHEAQLVRSTDEEYFFVGLEEPYHSITAIRDYEGKVMNPISLLERHQPDFCGLRRVGMDGFELNVLTPISLILESIILMTDGSREQEQSLENAELDLFSLDGETCKQHMDWTLEQLKKQTQDQVILGAIMFSCKERGPEAGGFLGERMSDATRFRKHFPTIPCLGFYAGAEIGPPALARHENVFQRGKAAVQGFTAVFALFIVPAMEPRSYDLDDSDANVIAFVRSRLGVGGRPH